MVVSYQLNSFRGSFSINVMIESHRSLLKEKFILETLTDPIDAINCTKVGRKEFYTEFKDTMILRMSSV